MKERPAIFIIQNMRYLSCRNDIYRSEGLSNRRQSGFETIRLFIPLYLYKAFLFHGRKDIKRLKAVVRPSRNGQDIVMVDLNKAAAANGKVIVARCQARDPFAVKIKKASEAFLREAFSRTPVLVVIRRSRAASRTQTAGHHRRHHA